MYRVLPRWALAVLGIVAVLPGAAAAEPLPEPLTLEQALALADEPHPQLAAARAEVDAARAGMAEAESMTGVEAGFEGQVAWVGLNRRYWNDATDDDHIAGVYLRKNLYDFGRSDAAEAAAEAELAGRRLVVTDTRQQRRLAIMRRYFDVLLADLAYMRENEDMAIAFVELDRVRDRHELGQVSDVELLRKESEYQTILRRRSYAQSRQRTARARLAQALNRPGELPATLAPPALPSLDRELPDVAAMQEAALDANPRLRALRRQVAAARERIEGARATDNPRIEAEVGAWGYTREFRSRDDWQAGVRIEVPFYRGGATEAEVGRRQAEFYRLQAQLREAEMAVRQAVLEACMDLESLQVERDETFALRDYRDVYLSQSRALYELEVKSDLGDAMVELTAAEYRRAETDYEIAMTWARLDALTGRMALDGTAKGEGDANEAE